MIYFVNNMSDTCCLIAIATLFGKWDAWHLSTLYVFLMAHFHLNDHKHMFGLLWGRLLWTVGARVCVLLGCFRPCCSIDPLNKAWAAPSSMPLFTGRDFCLKMERLRKSFQQALSSHMTLLAHLCTLQGWPNVTALWGPH